MKGDSASSLYIQASLCKGFYTAGIPLTNIAAAMGHTTEVHHQSYARFIPDGTTDLYAKRNARVA